MHQIVELSTLFSKFSWLLKVVSISATRGHLFSSRFFKSVDFLLNHTVLFLFLFGGRRCETASVLLSPLTLKTLN